MLSSYDEGTDFFAIIAGLLLGDTLVSYLLIIYQDYVLRTSIDLRKENGFKKGRKSWWYLAETVINANYGDDLALLANAPVQLETLQAAGYNGLHVNADKTEHMHFKREETVSTESDGHLKLVVKFTCYIIKVFFSMLISFR